MVAHKLMSASTTTTTTMTSSHILLKNYPPGYYNSTCIMTTSCYTEFYLKCEDGRCVCIDNYKPTSRGVCTEDLMETVGAWSLRIIISAGVFLICLILLHFIIKGSSRCCRRSADRAGDGERGGDGVRARQTVWWCDAPPNYQEATSDTPPPTYRDAVAKMLENETVHERGERPVLRSPGPLPVDSLGQKSRVPTLLTYLRGRSSLATESPTASTSASSVDSASTDSTTDAGPSMREEVATANTTVTSYTDSTSDTGTTTREEIATTYATVPSSTGTASADATTTATTYAAFENTTATTVATENATTTIITEACDVSFSFPTESLPCVSPSSANVSSTSATEASNVPPISAIKTQCVS